VLLCKPDRHIDVSAVAQGCWQAGSPYRLAPNTNALQHRIWQEAFPSGQCCSTNQADSSLEPLQIHLWTLALHTGLQSPNTSALQHRIWQEAFPTAECCSANQTDSSFVPLQLHLWPFSPHTGLQSPTRMQCSIRSGKNHSLLLTAALQTRLPAALCHCNYTYGHFLPIQACSHPQECSAAQDLARTIPSCSVLLCKPDCQKPCATADTPIYICSPYKSAVTQHQCTAAQDLATSIPLWSVLLYKPG